MALASCIGMADAPDLNTVAETEQTAKASIVIGESLKNKKSLAPGKLDSPFGIAFDSDNTMYIVELSGGRVHRRDA